MVSYSPFYQPDPSGSDTGRPNAAPLNAVTQGLANPSAKQSGSVTAQLGTDVLGAGSASNPAVAGVGAASQSMMGMMQPKNYGSATSVAPTPTDMDAYNEATDADIYGGSGIGGGGGAAGGMTGAQKMGAFNSIVGGVKDSADKATAAVSHAYDGIINAQRPQYIPAIFQPADITRSVGS